jgi:hypothetical protein
VDKVEERRLDVWTALAAEQAIVTFDPELRGAYQ